MQRGASSLPPKRPLQPAHSAVTPRAGARVAPAGGRLNGGVGRLLMTGLTLLLPAVTPGLAVASEAKEWRLLNTPVVVNATLRGFIPAERDSMAACDFAVTVTDSTRSETLGTYLIAVRDLRDAVRVLGAGVAWRAPYLFVRTECGGGTVWGCNKETVFEVTGHHALRIGSFIVADEPREAGQSLRNGQVLDTYDKLEDADLALSHVRHPGFRMVLRLHDEQLVADPGATWSLNKARHLEHGSVITSWLAHDSPADEKVLAAIIEDGVMAKYCGRANEVTDLVTRVKPRLTQEQWADVQRALELTVPLELPSAWRGRD